jgi:signal transduction histidine kinase/CheY-like chemotaxis protein
MTSEEVIRIVAEDLPVAIWMGEVPSGTVVYTNRAFREVLGIEPPPGAKAGGFVEPYGVHLPDGSPYPEAKMPFPLCIAARATVMVDDIVIHRRDGGKVNLRVFAKPIFDDKGTLTHVLEAFTDITREVEAERARIDADRKVARTQRLEAIGQLVAGIAHDFNNLLTVTKLVVSQLLPGEKDEARQDALTDVQSVTDSAITLVRSLLGFAGRVKQVLAPIEIGGVARSVVELARRTFDKRIELRTDCAPDGAWIKGDRGQLEQVLMNLLLNARDAIAGSGTVVVSTAVRQLAPHEIETCPAGTYSVLEVTDDGCGIAHDIRDRIFEPYFTTKTLGSVKGTGLGLSTVHGIVRTHGGFIEVRDPPSRGTTIRIAIPVCDPLSDDVSSGVVGGAPDVPRGSGEIVLVVDDERLVRAATARTLENLGYRVLEAESGRHALEIFAARKSEIAAVVLDMVMPGATAQEIFSAMQDKRPDIAVLVVTGTTMNDEIRALLESGVRAFLAKPYGEDQLAEALRAMISERASRRA